MNTRVINAIKGRLSLRAPQAESLEKLAQPWTPPEMCAISASRSFLIPSGRVPDVGKTSSANFPSLLLCSAPRVGKTRLWVPLSAICTLPMASSTSRAGPHLTIYEADCRFHPEHTSSMYSRHRRVAAYPPRHPVTTMNSGPAALTSCRQ